MARSSTSRKKHQQHRQHRQQEQPHQQEQLQEQQQRRRHKQSKRSNLARDQRATLLRLMTEPSYQHTKLGAAFSPARQLHSQLFWQLAARYIGAPLESIMPGGARLRSGGWAKGRSGCLGLHLCLPACAAMHQVGCPPLS